MSKKSPAFLFYSSDFLTGTMFMTNEQVGKYIRVLCMQHQQGHLAEEDMLNICSSYDNRIFSKFVKDEDGKYYNVRLEDEINRRNSFCESRSKNKKSKKSKTSKTYDKDMNNISSTYDEHMENENDNVNEYVNKYVKEEGKETTKNKKDERFNLFWDIYPKKVGKGKVEEWFKKNKPSEELTSMIIRAIEEQKYSQQWLKEDGQFIPNPATWLNQKRWQDGEKIDHKAEVNKVSDDDIANAMAEIKAIKERATNNGK